MENFVLDKYMKMFDLLGIEDKMELLTKLTENLNRNFKQKNKNKSALLEEIAGVWADTDDINVQDIYDARTDSDQEINLD